MHLFPTALMVGALALCITGSAQAQDASGEKGRKEACRSEAKLIYNQTGADREQKKQWRKAAIKECMQRASGQRNVEAGASQAGGDRKTRQTACRKEAKLLFTSTGEAEPKQRKAQVKNCMRKGRAT